MLDNYREIYNKELKRYEHEGGLTVLILNSTEVRAFVYEVCKACLASYQADTADEITLGEMLQCPRCQKTGKAKIFRRVP